MSEKKNSVKDIAEILEKKLDSDNMLNTKYSSQNYHMQKEILRHEKGMDKKEDEDAAL
jgi:hypothetical protein